jgi:1,4-dihydroxy-2-naphthoate octaprenyltransferase
VLALNMKEWLSLVKLDSVRSASSSVICGFKLSHAQFSFRLARALIYQSFYSIGR